MVGVSKRTVVAALVLAGCASDGTAQEAAEISLPPVTVSTTAKAKAAKKANAAKKAPAAQAATAAPTPAAAATSAASSNGPPANATMTASGNAIGASSASANAVRAAAPNATVVMEGAQLQQYNHLSVGDVVRRLPGVTFPGVNRSRDIKLRGIGKEYTQVLLDGRPLMDGDSSRSMEVDRIPASFVERIEITRSPLASMNSQGAAGTVNIITRRSFGPSGGQLTMGVGTINDNGKPGEFSGWQGGTSGPLRYFIAGGYQRRLVQESASELTYGLNGTTPNRGQISPQHRKFDEYTFLSRFELAIDPANTVVFSPSYLKTTENRDQHTRRLNAKQTFVDRDTHELRERVRETYGGQAEWLHNFTSLTSSRVFFDYQRGREDTSRRSWRTEYSAPGVIKGSPNSPQDPRFVPIDLERIASGGTITSTMSGHTVEAGIGWAQTSRGESEVRGAANTPYQSRNYDITEDIYYAYVSDSFSVLGNDLLTLGLRLEHSVTETVDFTRAQSEIDATELNPSIQYRLSPAENVDLRMGIARTLRRPDLRDLTPTMVLNGGSMSDPDTRGNPATSPEKIWGLDVGGDVFLFNRMGLLSANFFARSFEDKIEALLSRNPADNTRWIATPRNAGDGELYGLEVEGRLPMALVGIPDLTLWANATTMTSELKDSQTGQKRRFADQPDLITNVGVDYYVPLWATTFGLGYNRTYAYDQDIELIGGTHQLTSFSALDRLDASARISLDEGVVLTLTASNLLRPADERTLTTVNSTGTVTARTVSREPSPSVFYSRLSLGW